MCCNAASQPSKHRCWNRSRVSGPAAHDAVLRHRIRTKTEQGRHPRHGRFSYERTETGRPRRQIALQRCEDEPVQLSRRSGFGDLVANRFERRRAFRGRPSPKMRGTITERAIASKKYRNSLPIKLTLRYKDIFFSRNYTNRLFLLARFSIAAARRSHGICRAVRLFSPSGKSPVPTAYSRVPAESAFPGALSFRPGRTGTRRRRPPENATTIPRRSSR